MHSVNSINDDVDESEGKTQEVCKRKDSPVMEIDINTLLFILKIKLLSYEHSKKKRLRKKTKVSAVIIMIHGTGP